LKSVKRVTPSGLRLAEMNFSDWASSDLTPSFQDAAFHFLCSLQSKNTQRAYANDLSEFWETLAEKGLEIHNVTEINERMLIAWSTHLSHKHKKHNATRGSSVQTTVARRLSAVSSFLEFCFQRRLIERNPAKLLKRPKVKRESRTNAFTRDEVLLLVHYCESMRNELRAEGGRAYRSWSLRYFVLSTLFTVGMRAAELCSLRIADLEITPQFSKLHMVAKGNETHSPILHPKTVELLKLYLQEFRQNATSEEPLFVRAQNVSETTCLTQSALFEMIQDVSKKVGIDKKVSPHSCRATLATLLHNGGVPIGQIQDLLNHKQITTTALYIKKAEELDSAAAPKIDIL
jgi:integrase/recombinase XerD